MQNGQETNDNDPVVSDPVSILELAGKWRGGLRGILGGVKCGAAFGCLHTEWIRYR